MSFIECLPLLNTIALIVIAAAIIRWKHTRVAKTPASGSADAAPLAVRKSKYASVSSADFAAPVAPAAAATTTAGSGPGSDEVSQSGAALSLSPAEERAARFDATLRNSTLKAFQLVAAARRKREHRTDGGVGVGVGVSGSARPLPRLEGAELARAGEELAARFPHYDASSTDLPSLRRFQHVAQHTHCIFAKKSKCWGSPPIAAAAAAAAAAGAYSTAAAVPLPSVEEQTLAAVPGFVEFTLRIKDSYPELREHASIGDLAAAHVHAHAATTTALADDPARLFVADSRSLLQWRQPLSQWGLDAFVVEIAGASHSDTVSHFATTVRTVLSALSAADPVLPVATVADLDSFGVDVAVAQCMSALGTGASAARAEETFSSPRWHFKFLGETFFVTCFAPCYPATGNARYMFGQEAAAIVAAHAQAQAAQAEGGAAAGNAEAHLLHDFSDRCFVLFQPELAFLRHNLSADTPHTNWDEPRTERDRIRAAFRRADREYVIPHTVAYPTAHFIVPPLLPFSQPIVRWWRDDPEEDSETFAST